MMRQLLTTAMRLHLAAAMLLPTLAIADDVVVDAIEESTVSPDMKGSSIAASLTLRVPDRRAATLEAIALAEAKGGWFSNMTAEEVALRIPTQDVKQVMDELRAMGDVVNRTYTRLDHTQEIAELTARIEGREDVLAKYMDVLATARSKSVVAVEREISRAISELEGLKGRRRFLQTRLEHAQVQVRFVFKDRKAPSRDGSSSFAWLNTMNMADVLTDFENGWRSTPSLVDVSVPDGFAPYRGESKFRAVSPDDVVYRVRSAKNEPLAELGFWSEALRTRMSDAGYTVISDKTLAGDKGYVLEVGAANGARDQTYVIGLFVRGKKLVLAEATGESESVAARRAAIMTSIEGVEL
ncbi:MAG: hypothetical protein ACI9MC_001681 [Kiritimatiellia bacterium]|jgi:hypothetical protein